MTDMYHPITELSRKRYSHRAKYHFKSMLEQRIFRKNMQTIITPGIKRGCEIASLMIVGL